MGTQAIQSAALLVRSVPVSANLAGSRQDMLGTLQRSHLPAVFGLAVISLGLGCHRGSQQACQRRVSVRLQMLRVDDQVISWPVKVGESGPASKTVVFVEGACCGVGGRAAGLCHQQSATAGRQILLYLIEQQGGHAVTLY